MVYLGKCVLEEVESVVLASSARDNWGKCFLKKWVSELIHSSQKIYLYLIIIGESVSLLQDS